MEKIKLFKKRNFGETIGTTFDLLRQNFILLSRSFLYLVMPILAVSILIISVGFLGLIKSTVKAKLGSSSTAVNTMILAIGYIGYILTFYVQAVVVHELVIAYEHSEHPSHITVSDIWVLIKADMGSIFASFFGLMPLFFFIGVVSALIYTAFASISDSAAGLWILIMYLANVYLYICLSNFLMLRLRSEYNIYQAISKSISLTIGAWRWWRTLGIMLVLSLILFCLYTVSLYPLSIVIYIYRVHFLPTMVREDYLNYLYIMMTILILYGGVVMSYLSNLIILGTTVNYYSLIEEKEHVGLQVAIDNIGLHSSTNQLEGEY